MRAFARYKIEIWCMDLAYVDKLAKDNRGIKYLLVRKDVFDKTIDVGELKTKDSKEALRAFAQMITKRKRPQKMLTREKNLQVNLKNFTTEKEYRFCQRLKQRQLSLRELFVH